MSVHSRTCSIDGCERRHFGKGYCRTHYARVARGKDPAAPIQSQGEHQRFFLDVVVPFSGDDCLAWPFFRTDAGYGRFYWRGRFRHVSRVACEMVHGVPPTPEHHAAHSCGRGHLGCVNPRHLEWKTPAANNAQKVEHGTVLRGEAVYAAKLTEDAVRFIRKSEGKISAAALSRRFEVSDAAVRDILSRRNWAWLS